ncbi:MAG: cache domain-containing protein, partial [Selenomonadaceae bacterium]|nr:cache domain-containing protein [Selenomonadaceae bacterium]
MRDKSIRKQTLLLILSCSLGMLLLSGGIAMYGMMDIKSSAVETGQEIGRSAALNSGKALQEDARKDIKRLVEERGKRIDMIFDHLGSNVSMIAAEMSTILEHPGRYQPMEISEPQRSNAGILVPQLQFAPGVDRSDPALREEIGLTANIQDWLLRLNASQEMVAAVYVASRNGFGIMVDNRSEKKFKEGEDAPLPLDFRLRPWYQETVEKRHLIYSDVFVDVYSGNFGVTCAAPYFNREGALAGVVGAGMFLNDIKGIVQKTSIGGTGFGFVIDREGRVLFSSKNEGPLAAVDVSGGASLFDSPEESLAAVARDMADWKTGLQEVTVDGVPCYLAYRPLKGMNGSFGVVLAVEEATMSAQANEQVIVNSTQVFLDRLNQSIRSSLLAALFLVLVLLSVVPFLSNKVATRFVQPIHELSDGVREIASGNL